MQLLSKMYEMFPQVQNGECSICYFIPLISFHTSELFFFYLIFVYSFGGKYWIFCVLKCQAVLESISK